MVFGICFVPYWIIFVVYVQHTYICNIVILCFFKEYPLKSDLVERWGDVEGLWNYILGTLMSVQENPDFPILISQPGLNPKKNTEKIAEVS